MSYDVIENAVFTVSDVKKANTRSSVVQFLKIHISQGQGRSQEFDLGGYKWVKETKQPHKKFKVDCFGGIYTDIPPVATPLHKV